MRPFSRKSSKSTREPTPVETPEPTADSTGHAQLASATTIPDSRQLIDAAAAALAGPGAPSARSGMGPRPPKARARPKKAADETSVLCVIL